MSSVTELAADEQAALRAYESTIEAGLATFLTVGRCLAAIRDAKLYRGTHSTFESYCVGRWKVTRPRAYQLIAAAGVADEMSKILDIGPMTESHVAELAKAPPEARAKAWDEAVATAPRSSDGRPQVTAKAVRAAVQRQATSAGGSQPQLVPFPVQAGKNGRSVAQAAQDTPNPVTSKPMSVKVTVNTAITQLRRAIRKGGDAHAAVEAVRQAGSGGLYGPGNNPRAAFRGLLDVIQMLLDRQP